MNIILIEDEPLTAEDLEETLGEIDSSIQVLRILPSVTQSISFFRQNQLSIDLIFSDIQLQDGLSFEIFKAVAVTPPVVFCTAYNEYALQAFDANGIDYILKPFSRSAVEKALQKYKNLKHSLSAGINIYEKVISLLENKTPKAATSVLVHHKDKIIPILLRDIALFYVENEVVHLQTLDKKTYTLSQTMEDLERKAGSQFFRANRQFLLNRAVVTDAQQHFARKLVVHLTIPFAEPILISKNKVSQFLEWLAD